MKKIIVLTLTLLLSFVLLCSCTNEAPYEKSLTNLLDSLKACNFERAEEYIWGESGIIDGLDEDELTGDARDFYKTMFSSLEYKILSSRLVDDNTAEVEAEITNVNITPAIEKFLDAAFSYILANMYNENAEGTDAEVERILTDSVKNTQFETFTKKVTVEVKKDEGEWEVVVGEGDFADVISGGLISSFKDMFGSLMGE